MVTSYRIYLRMSFRLLKWPERHQWDVPIATRVSFIAFRPSWQTEQGNIYVCTHLCMCVLVTQSCLTLCDLIDCSPQGSSVLWILQARILEWVAIPFFRGSSQPRDWMQVSPIAGGFFTVWATKATHRHTKITTICRATIYENNLKTSRKDFLQLKI